MNRIINNILEVFPAIIALIIVLFTKDWNAAITILAIGIYIEVKRRNFITKAIINGILEELQDFLDDEIKEHESNKNDLNMKVYENKKVD